MSNRAVILAATVLAVASAPGAAQHANLPAASVVSISGGARHCIIAKSDGSVWTWGINWNGLIGDGTVSVFDPNNPFVGGTNDRHTPVQVHGPGNVGFLTSVVEVMGGEPFNFARRSDGTVWSWGWNVFGSLGDGTFNDSYVPVQVKGLASIVALGGRGYHSLALRSDGSVWAWGYNASGELGDGTTVNRNAPVQVVGLNSVLAVTGGYVFSVALMADHTLRSWGGNQSGELGDGTNTMRTGPVPVFGLTNVAQVSAGWKHAVAVKTDGTVWTWGQNINGELGNGTTTDSNVPVQVAGLNGVVAVSGGDCHTNALKADGSVWSWGCNDRFQLGDGTSVERHTPVKVSNLAGVASMAARDYHNIALKSDGSVWTWGWNINGQLGDNTTIDRAIPVQVTGLSAAPVSNPAMALDAPANGSQTGSSFTVAGWAVDLGAPNGSGIDALHVYAFPQVGSGFGPGIFLGAAALGQARPDVGAVFGSQFSTSGFTLPASNLPVGNYRVMAYAYSSVASAFILSRAADIVVAAPAANPAMAIDVPTPGAYSQPFVLAGWAVDRGAPAGAGVDAIHVWAFPVTGGPTVFLGAAGLGGARPDVGAVFGPQFSASGYYLSLSGLTPGRQYDIGVYAHSAVTGTFNQSRVVRVTVQ